MKIDEAEVTKELIGKLNNNSCEFYRGSQKIQVKDASIKTISYAKGEYSDGKNSYNYMVSGKGEFTIVDIQIKNLISNGLEYYKTLTQIEDNKITSISRIDISNIPI